MGHKTRSISQRIEKAKYTDRKCEVIQDWASYWEEEQFELITQLEQAIKNDDYDLLCRTTGQLKAVSDKKFDGLSNALEKLRQSIDNGESKMKT